MTNDDLLRRADAAPAGDAPPNAGAPAGEGGDGEIVGGPHNPQQIAAQKRLQQTQAQVDEVSSGTESRSQISHSINHCNSKSPTRSWTSCARTWRRCWSATASCRSWTTVPMPCSRVPRSLSSRRASSRGNSGFRT